MSFRRRQISSIDALIASLPDEQHKLLIQISQYFRDKDPDFLEFIAVLFATGEINLHTRIAQEDIQAAQTALAEGEATYTSRIKAFEAQLHPLAAQLRKITQSMRTVRAFFRFLRSSWRPTDVTAILCITIALPMAFYGVGYLLSLNHDYYAVGESFREQLLVRAKIENNHEAVEILRITDPQR